MFESITVRWQGPPDSTEPLDLGLLAEAMLFYGDVHVVADQTMLRQLVRSLGPDLLLEYARRGFMRISYVPQTLVVSTNNAGTPFERFDLGMVSASHTELQEVLPKIFIAVTGRQGRGRRLAQQFSPYAKPLSLETSVCDAARADCLDSKYLSEVVRYLANAQGVAGEEFRFDLSRDETGGFAVVTDEVLSRSGVSPTRVLGQVLEARGDLFFAATNNSELATNPTAGAILSVRLERTIQRRRESKEQLRLFQDFVLDDARALAEALTGGSYTFADFLSVLERADRFRGWIREKAPDTKLAKAYFQEVTKNTWVDKLPSRIVRWVLFTGAGVALDLGGAGGAGTATGVALSAGDAFLLDKLIKKWKPNQFVDSSVKPLVRKR